MKPTFFKGAVAGGIAGALCAAATVALAGTGINGIFNLGVDNSVDGQTLLHGNTGSNPQLRVNNQQGTDAAIGVLGAHSAAAGAGAGAQGRLGVDRGQRIRRLRADHVGERGHQLQRRKGHQQRRRARRLRSGRERTGRLRQLEQATTASGGSAPTASSAVGPRAVSGRAPATAPARASTDKTFGRRAGRR